MDLKEIKNGNLNKVFKLETEKSNYIIRLSNFDNNFETYILKELEKNNINSPRLKAKFRFENKYVLICDYIVGDNPNIFNDIFFKNLILEIKKIHKLNIPILNDDSNSENVEKLKMYYNFVKDSIFLKNDIEIIKNVIFELEKNLNFDIMSKTLIHSDIKKENVLVNDEKVYLIDFGNCYFGNRMIELIRIIMWFFIREENFDFDKITKIVSYYFEEDEITQIEIDNLYFLINFCLIYNLLKDIYLNIVGFLPKDYVIKNSLKWLNTLKNKDIITRIEEVFKNVKRFAK